VLPVVAEPQQKRRLRESLEVTEKRLRQEVLQLSAHEAQLTQELTSKDAMLADSKARVQVLESRISQGIGRLKALEGERDEAVSRARMAASKSAQLQEGVSSARVHVPFVNTRREHASWYTRAAMHTCHHAHVTLRALVTTNTCHACPLAVLLRQLAC
jgi:chromosome segregation ATPase